MSLRLGKVTVADVLAAQPVTTNLLKFMRASIKMIGVSNLQSFIASMTQDRKSGSAGMPRPTLVPYTTLFRSRRFGGATCDDKSAQIYARFDKNDWRIQPAEFYRFHDAEVNTFGYF